jgi:hypothetical protein
MPSYQLENNSGTWESTVGPITEHHVEEDGDPWQGRFGRSKGLADLVLPRLALCFLPVTHMWSLMTVPGVWVSWRRFAWVVGPWILVLNMWHCLIRREVLLLDWWGVMDTWHPVCQHVATWPGVGPTGPMIQCDLILCISLSSELWSIQMIYPFRFSRRARHNGAVQIGIWVC